QKNSKRSAPNKFWSHFVRDAASRLTKQPFLTDGPVLPLGIASNISSAALTVNFLLFVGLYVFPRSDSDPPDAGRAAVLTIAFG
ncbi:MAG: hypothetical protein KDD44_10640, partial [Bdellovibrionales bacterium]|nr:hypothetical protein [Bdellovibrionales bacterium]